MRLIDADELLMLNSWDFYDEWGNKNSQCKAVENAPTVDAICPHYIRNEHGRGDDSLCRKFQCEVSALPRKGRWLIKPHKMTGDTPCCSECGAFEPIKRRFCPNCGADMRDDIVEQERVIAEARAEMEGKDDE